MSRGSGWGNRLPRGASALKAAALGLAAAFLSHPATLLACTACYGKSDEPIAQGMNWGIMSLLAVVGFVLASVAAFFVFLARRAAAQPSAGS